MNKFWKFLPLVFLLAYTLVVYRPFFFQGKLPIPADTIVGLYHPWRDYFADKYPNGIPFKNFQITDSVRQQYPWRKLSIDSLKRGDQPRWNPYSFAGTPLLGNLQSASYYPLNILYWSTSLPAAWATQVILQTILGGIFMYLYLRNLKLSAEATTLGALSWVGSGFFVAWLEWNTTVHVVLWLPLILLAIDKMFFSNRGFFWSVIFIFSLASSFLAGYLQPFFYVLLITESYIIARLVQTRKYPLIIPFIIYHLSFIILVSPQLLPTWEFIKLSARDLDQANWQRPDWFLPWQNLVQLAIPDYFGNPATLNYFGIWNYQEFVSYFGIVGLVFAMFALLVRKDKKTRFFTTLLLIAATFALANPIAKLPFILKLPFISSAQPSRLVMVIDFALVILAALGLDSYLNGKMIQKKIFTVLILLSSVIVILWMVAVKLQLPVSLHNLYLPTAIFLLTSLLIYLVSFPKIQKAKSIIILLLLSLAVFDLTRFASKFEPFSSKEFLYPSTRTMQFLQEQTKSGLFRVAAIDDRILPPNFNIMYRLQAISGYDPLYLRRYGEYIIAMERGKPDVSPPWGFNRIITPKNYTSVLFSLLNVRYILSLEEINSPSLYEPVLKEGRTLVYEVKQYQPRAFFVEKITSSKSKDEALKRMFSGEFTPLREAVVENWSNIRYSPSEISTPMIFKYDENEAVIRTNNESAAFLVLTDAYYPSWKATVDGNETKIYITDYAFRGILVPAGSHLIRFFIN